MVVNIYRIRRNSLSLIDEIIFEYKMKKRKGKDSNAKKVLASYSMVFFINGKHYNGLYSYEMMNQAMTTGDFVNALTFGILPVLQGFDINNLHMLNTYIKDKIAS